MKLASLFTFELKNGKTVIYNSESFFKMQKQILVYTKLECKLNLKLLWNKNNENLGKF